MPENTLKAATSLISLSIYFITLFCQLARADDFNTSVQSGRSMGTGLVTDFSPHNLNQTLQNKGLGTADTLIPNADEAQQNKSSYTQFYDNPGAMGSANTNTDAGIFVNDIYTNRQKFDLTEDPTFGSKCLKSDPDGKCIQWSTGKDLITNTYTDCRKVVIPQNGQGQTEATCTGTDTIQATACETKSYVNIVAEDVVGPCSGVNPDYRAGQINAYCRDVYKWYKVYTGTGQDADDCSCDNHAEALCSTPPLFDVVSQAPTGSTYLGMSYENFRDRGRKDGWDDCTSDRYYWYVQYQKSVVERLFLQNDSPCGSNISKWSQECTVSRLEQCDPSGNNCVVSIENGQDTGQMPDFNYLTKVLQGTFTDSVSPTCTDYGDWYSCPAQVCVSGSCPAGVFTVATPSSSSMPIGENRTNISQFRDSGIAYLSYDDYLYYKDPRVCRDLAGSLDNYVVCRKYYTVEVSDSAADKVLTTTSERVDSSYGYYGATVTQARIYGGPDVSAYLNNWDSKVTFSCPQAQDNCRSLKDQGCVQYSSKCLDSNCDQLQYTYHCGGPGGVRNYQVAYNCAGEIRCMGTECTDASYQANQDFGKMAAVMEVLNQYRVDSSETEIFPGEKKECQNSPENCCKKPSGGVSVTDYVATARATLSAYSMATGGYAATWAGYANAASYVMSSGSVGSLQGVLGTTVSDALGTTTSVVYTGPGEIGINSGVDTMIGNTGVEAIGTDAGATLTSDALASTIATVASVICIALIVYSIAKMIYDFMFQCTKDDILTSYKLGLNLCHEVGSIGAGKVLGLNTKKKKVYYCFNTILARVLHEQARPQIGKGWGDPENPDCSGFTPGELSSIDFSKVDLSEYMQYVKQKTEIPTDQMQEILNKTQGQVKQSFQK